MDYTFIGTIEQISNGCDPLMTAIDGFGNKVADLIGPRSMDCCCSCSGACGTNPNFDIVTPDGEQIGQVMKPWSGLVPQSNVDGPNFGLTFSSGLDVQIKGLLLAGAFLIVNIELYASFSNRYEKVSF
jgi:hypothetical protein